MEFRNKYHANHPALNTHFDIYDDANKNKIGEVLKVDNGNGWYAMDNNGVCYGYAKAPDGDPDRETAVAAMLQNVRIPI